ncbi:MFS transporter [Actinomycetospora termitidis]|uniref:MFS transporter n=1 Tax=Actinomycetospora termitidis TaxID=3053470 RepID=A0ABT7M1R0_9PSEU|nr:MFS transporter [Actinomycetospora sp. Odt1-22]MDL5154391.1 MFS transporter [Actinomycetospora sp. Odt1-22]
MTTGWAGLVAPGRRGAVGVLCGGVLLFAVDTYVTASLLPSAIAEIGGERFYSWVVTVYLLPAVVTSALTGRALAAWSARRAYLLALLAFGLGTAIDAVAPSMAVLLVGRAVQGTGGGLLAGLAYALLRTALPRELWTRGSAAISAMWGVGLLVGPVLGGVFAEAGIWRGAFVTMVGVTLLVAVAVPTGLRRAAPRAAGARTAFPVLSVVLVGAAAAVLSVSGLAVSGSGVGTRGILVAAGGLVVALLLLGGLVRHERRPGAARVFPLATYTRGGPLAAVYVTAAVLIWVSAVEAFVPLFGQRLGGLSPLAAGFLGVALACGWVVGELTSASVGRGRLAVGTGPLLTVVGFALLTVTQTSGGVAWWALGLVLAGLGVGVAWPHLTAGAMATGSADDADDDPDDAEGDRASAAITMVQMLAVALGASFAGVAVALGGADPASSATFLYGGMGVVAVLGALTALRGRAAA